MVFDADMAVAALEHPVIKLDGRKHTGRLLSVPQAIKWKSKILGAAKNPEELEDNEALEIIEGFLGDIFANDSDVVARIMELPTPVVYEVVWDFLALQDQTVHASGENPTSTND